MSVNNWVWHNSLDKVVNVRSPAWWRKHQKDILIWMESEKIRNPYVNYIAKDCPNLWLYTEEQMSYFSLRWHNNEP